MTKKAMSPLFSTIILIGFAIALGGVVMSWGKGSYAMENEPAECKQTSLSLVSYDTGTGICSKEGKLQFTIQNNGEIPIDGIKISVIGDKSIYSSVISRRMEEADVAMMELEHPDVGSVKKVMFTPKFAYLGEEKTCPKNGFSAEEIGEC